VNPWFNRLASISLIGLLFLCLAWELWLAPLRPGGSMLALKALPLLFPLFGILRGKRYTHQWTSLLAWPTSPKALVRAASDQGQARTLAMAETALATLLFAGCLGHARADGAPSRASKLRIELFLPGTQLVQRVDVGLGRSNHDVRIGALPIDDAAVLGQAHRHLALRIGTGGDAFTE
jgi:uncharacterized membrane protein